MENTLPGFIIQVPLLWATIWFSCGILLGLILIWAIVRDQGYIELGTFICIIGTTFVAGPLGIIGAIVAFLYGWLRDRPGWKRRLFNK